MYEQTTTAAKAFGFTREHGSESRYWNEAGTACVVMEGYVYKVLDRDGVPVLGVVFQDAEDAFAAAREYAARKS